MALVNEKGDHILFDITYHTRMGYLICKNIKESIKINGTEHNNTKTNEAKNAKKKIDINKAHELFSHTS